MNKTEHNLVDDIHSGSLESLSHEDHVQLAWLLLRQERFENAIMTIRRLLKKFAVSKGKPEIFHETITWVFSLIIHERITTDKDVEDWHEFKSRNADLFDSKALLANFYSTERLRSEMARGHFLLPDLCNS